eukprot:scaffold1118_cov135-Cylindrotheca_fusiformis.AAC.18
MWGTFSYSIIVLSFTQKSSEIFNERRIQGEIECSTNGEVFKRRRNVTSTFWRKWRMMRIFTIRMLYDGVRGRCDVRGQSGPNIPHLSVTCSMIPLTHSTPKRPRVRHILVQGSPDHNNGNAHHSHAQTIFSLLVAVSQHFML